MWMGGPGKPVELCGFGQGSLPGAAMKGSRSGKILIGDFHENGPLAARETANAVP